MSFCLPGLIDLKSPFYFIRLLSEVSISGDVVAGVWLILFPHVVISSFLLISIHLVQQSNFIIRFSRSSILFVRSYVPACVRGVSVSSDVVPQNASVEKSGSSRHRDRSRSRSKDRSRRLVCILSLFPSYIGIVIGAVIVDVIEMIIGRNEDVSGIVIGAIGTETTIDAETATLIGLDMNVLVGMTCPLKEKTLMTRVRGASIVTENHALEGRNYYH